MTNSQGSQVGRTVALSPELDEALRRMAEREESSVSELIQRWILEKLEQFNER